MASISGFLVLHAWVPSAEGFSLSQMYCFSGLNFDRARGSASYLCVPSDFFKNSESKHLCSSFPIFLGMLSVEKKCDTELQSAEVTRVARGGISRARLMSLADFQPLSFKL